MVQDSTDDLQTFELCDMGFPSVRSSYVPPPVSVEGEDRTTFYILYVYLYMYLHIYIYVNNDLIKYIIVIVPVEPANARQARDPSPNDHPGSVR